MAKNPVEVLKEGLRAFKRSVEIRKQKIQSLLRAKKQISEEDERWLDHDANDVEETKVVDTLETASD